MYLLNGSLLAVSGKADELEAILLKASKEVATCKGCKLYCISRDSEKNQVIFITEIWESKEDHAASLQLESVQLLIKSALPLLAEMPKQGQELQVIGGHGI